LKRALDNLRESAHLVVRGLLLPRLYVVLLIGLAVWVVAYQVKRDYVVQIADLAYHPYISNFNDIEKTSTDPPLVYRWSKGNPRIFLPGIGNEPVQLSITTIGSRPSGPPPEITLSVRGQTFKVQTEDAEHTDTLLVERGDAWNGDFFLDVSVPSFSPPGDPRELGVIIKEVMIRPATYDLRPIVVPSVGTLGFFLVGITATYLVGLITTRGRWIAMPAVFSGIVLIAVGIVAVRPEMGFLAGQLPSLTAWALLFGAVGRALLDALVWPGGRWSGFVAAAGSAAFAIAFTIRFGGLTYAQFLTSDLVFHVHNTESVLRGDWLFTAGLPDGTQVPYPPAHYALVSVLSWLLGGSEEMLGLLLKWSSSLLDAACCLGLAWAGWRLVPGALGGTAALVYACSPAAFDLFSAGNYTNIFAQSVLNLTLLGALVFLNHWHRGKELVPSLFLTTGFCLTMLGHYGMMLGALAILGFYAVWIIMSKARKRPTGGAIWLLGSGGAALIASFALYYWHFANEMMGQWTAVFDKLLGRSPNNKSAVPQGSPDFAEGLRKLPGKVYDLVGGYLVISGVFGAALLSRLNPAARALIGSWLLATVLFAFLDQVVGDSVRWYYLGAAAVSLLAGRFLGLLLTRGSRAKVFCGLVLGVMALNMLLFWTGLIFSRYH
jgi:hypothetical protein